jgi:hypothetical protein
MNEKIKQLAEQAYLYQEHDTFLTAALENFAELIVKECSKIIVNGGYRNPALGEKHSLTPPEIATMIQEHFGVEE